jgi:hypothetical protein
MVHLTLYPVNDIAFLVKVFTSVRDAKASLMNFILHFLFS